MRGTRGFGVLAVLAVVAGVAGPIGAATHAQSCHGPVESTQSGRASLEPGINGLSTKQQMSWKVSLFSCSPARSTRGSGTLKSAYATAAQTCVMLKKPKTFKETAKITWKSDATSTIAITFALTGGTRLVNVTGRVTSGLFAGKKVTGQYKYREVVSPYGVTHNGNGVAQACANKVKPKKYGRIAIVALNLFTTKPFNIG